MTTRPSNFHNTSQNPTVPLLGQTRTKKQLMNLLTEALKVVFWRVFFLMYKQMLAWHVSGLWCSLCYHLQTNKRRTNEVLMWFEVLLLIKAMPQTWCLCRKHRTECKCCGESHTGWTTSAHMMSTFVSHLQPINSHYFQLCELIC